MRQKPVRSSDKAANSSLDEGRNSVRAHPALVDDFEPSVEALDAGLPVVERLHRRKPSRVQGAPRKVDVHPPVRIAGTGAALVEHVEIEEPEAVNRLTLWVDVSGTPVVRLRDGRAVAEVARIPPPGRVGGLPPAGDVEIAAVELANRAMPVLKVAAPVEARRVEVGAVRTDVTPPVRRDYGRQTLVESEGTAESPAIGRSAVGPDVPRFPAAAHCGQPRFVKLENLAETFGVERGTVPDMVRARRRHTSILPVHGSAATGLRMLQPRQSARFRYVAARVR